MTSSVRCTTPSSPFGVERIAISSAVSAWRASPSQIAARKSRASKSSSLGVAPYPLSVSDSALSSSFATSSGERACSSKTSEREVSGVLMKKFGLCVVAPIRTTVPSSTYGRRTSCCDLLKRCISSMKRIVPLPPSSSRALSHILRMSATPERTPESRTKLRFVVFATTSASVVFPQPGGP